MTTAGRTAPGQFLRLEASALPACFGELSRRVAGLWYIGDPTALEGAPHHHVAIVGTREASPYGIRMAERLATACAGAGLVVVSGLARGVDAAAHRAALVAGGRTIGVQGTGVDVPYPASHRALHEAVARRGTVISEMEPGTLATPGCFPRRNRIIAALSMVTVVVEAGFKSGAINTASQALEMGRTVAAVPGRVDEERAMGSNTLLRDGAQMLTSPSDLLALFGLVNHPEGPAQLDGAPFGAGAGSPHMDLEGRSSRDLAEELLRAELDGAVERDGLRYLSRRR